MGSAKRRLIDWLLEKAIVCFALGVSLLFSYYLGVLSHRGKYNPRYARRPNSYECSADRSLRACKMLGQADSIEASADSDILSCIEAFGSTVTDLGTVPRLDIGAEV